MQAESNYSPAFYVSKQFCLKGLRAAGSSCTFSTSTRRKDNPLSLKLGGKMANHQWRKTVTLVESRCRHMHNYSEIMSEVH